MTKRMSLPIRKLALGGGGAKGILHIGALMELQKHQPLEFPDGIYGSSVGAIIASCIAFRIPIENILSFVKVNSSIQTLVPSKFDIQSISSLFSSKGLYSMNIFETRIRELFETHNIDIRTKRLKDANMPLHIVSTNITKGVPAIFSDDVYLLDALKCSCCIPFMFRPQQLGDSLYVDGDILTPNLTAVCPADTIVINLDKQRKRRIEPSQIEFVNIIEYSYDLYSMISSYNQTQLSKKNTISLSYPELRSDSDISEMNIEDILIHAGNKFGRFFSTQILHEEVAEL